MTEADLRDTLRDMNEQVQWILGNQLNRARIEEELARRDAQPLEEDFIDADFRGEEIGQPQVRIIDDVQIIVRKLHRRGARAADILGADLLYEIEGEKFAIIQYKTANRRGRLLNDPGQLNELMAGCGRGCPPRPDVIRGCGAWHAVRNRHGLYHPACVASAIFGVYASRGESRFTGGVSKRDFDSFFARCHIGAPVREQALDHLVEIRIESGQLVVRVTQRGRF